MYIFESNEKIYIWYLQTTTYNFCEGINNPINPYRSFIGVR
jgi:hypothetical protein